LPYYDYLHLLELDFYYLYLRKIFTLGLVDTYHNGGLRAGTQVLERAKGQPIYKGVTIYLKDGDRRWRWRWRGRGRWRDLEGSCFVRYYAFI
jgi:hypothetical protein